MRIVTDIRCSHCGGKLYVDETASDPTAKILGCVNCARQYLENGEPYAVDATVWLERIKLYGKLYNYI